MSNFLQNVSQKSVKEHGLITYLKKKKKSLHYVVWKRIVCPEW